jgi:hypothetical protein
MSTEDSIQSRDLPSRTFRWVHVIIVGTMLALMGWSRLNSAYFSRILETDELITLQNYTWLGIHEDGSRREINSIDRLMIKDGLSLRRFALGVYCATGRWTEPNNHIPYSLAVNACLSLPGRVNICARLPALLFAFAFAISMSQLSSAAGRDRSWGIDCCNRSASC